MHFLGDKPDLWEEAEIGYGLKAHLLVSWLKASGL